MSPAEFDGAHNWEERSGFELGSGGHLGRPTARGKATLPVYSRDVFELHVNPREALSFQNGRGYLAG